MATDDLDKGNLGAFERLRAWPAVFNVNQAARFLGTPDNDLASVYLARWKKRGMVQSTGPRSGVYFNLVANPHAAQDHLVDALLHAFPSAVMIGASVLHSAGWTTQIPSKLQVACLGAREGRRSVPVWDEVAFYTRPKGWYEQLHSQISRDRRAAVLPALLPAAALADACSTGSYKDAGEWRPDADDLDIPPECHDEVREAWLAAGLPEDELEAMLDEDGPRAPAPRG